MSPAILIVIPGLEREHEYMRRLLEDEGCLIFCAESVERALKLMDCVTINLILACQDTIAVDDLAEAAWRLNPRTYLLVVGGGARSKTGWSDSYVRRPVTSAGLKDRVLNLILGSFIPGNTTSAART